MTVTETKPNIVQRVLDPNKQFVYQHDILSGFGKIVFHTENGEAVHTPDPRFRIHQNTSRETLEIIYIKADDRAVMEENPHLAQGYRELAEFALHLSENHSVLPTLTPPIIHLPAAKRSTESDLQDVVIPLQTVMDQTSEPSSRRRLRKKDLQRQRNKDKKEKSRKINDVEGKRRRHMNPL